MTIVRVRGIKRFRHRKSGIWYTYHRVSCTRIEPPHAFGSPEFFAALNAAEARHKPQERPAGTFGAMLRSYRESPEYASLKDRTRRDYQKVFDWLKGIDEMPVALITPAFVKGLRDKAYRQRKRRFANYVRSVLSLLFGHGIEAGLAKTNPVRDTKQVRRPTNAPLSNRAWTEDEKRIVLDTAPPHLLIPIAIARWTGLRQGDVIALGKTAYRDGAVNLKTAKRGVPHWFPCPEPLRAILDAIPPHDGMRLCVSSYGTPWTANGFRASFFKHIRKLEGEGLIEPGLTFHGLRTSFAEEARENGFDTRTIADALAQRDAKSAEHYTRNADRKRSARAVSAALDGTNSGQELSTRVSTFAIRQRKKSLSD
jgi:integrase